MSIKNNVNLIEYKPDLIIWFCKSS